MNIAYLDPRSGKSEGKLCSLSVMVERLCPLLLVMGNSAQQVVRSRIRFLEPRLKRAVRGVGADPLVTQPT